MEDNIKIKAVDKPVINYVNITDNSAKYYPDFYISNDNTLIEVKSEYIYEKENNILKFKASITQGYNLCLLIFDRKWYLINYGHYLANDLNNDCEELIEI